MGKLAALRFARWARKSSQPPEYPHLEALIEEETEKVSDGFHLARWLAPSIAAFFAIAPFLILTFTVHPLFWIGVAGMLALGAGLGVMFHVLAKRITPAQRLLRQRCHKLAGKLLGLGNLTGVKPSLSPEVAVVLDHAAKAYLATRPFTAPQRPGVWAEASHKAQAAMDEAMAEMLTLALPDSTHAQEVELSRG